MAKAAPTPKSHKKSTARTITTTTHDHDHDTTNDDSAKAARRRRRAGDVAKARERLGAAGRNDPARAARARSTRSATCRRTRRRRRRRPRRPTPQELLTNGWRLFEQRRPGAAEKEFRAALAARCRGCSDARVGIGMARLSAGDADGAKRGAVGGGQAPPRARSRSCAPTGVKDAFSRAEAQPYHPRGARPGLPGLRSGALRRRLDRLERVFSRRRGRGRASRRA